METDAIHRRLGRNIRLFRRAYGWTQAELGDRIGLSKGQIARYERGLCAAMTATRLEQFSEALRISAHLLTVDYEDLLG